MSDKDKVLPFPHVVHSSGREPALSDQELIRIREMLKDFDKIGEACPIARRVIHGC